MLNAPAWDGRSVTPSDSANLPVVNSRALYIGGTGDVKVSFVSGGGTVTFVAVPVGTILPIQVSKVFNTGTTATQIVALY